MSLLAGTAKPARRMMVDLSCSDPINALKNPENGAHLEVKYDTRGFSNRGWSTGHC